MPTDAKDSTLHVIGIDPSLTSTGIAVWWNDGGKPATACVTTKAGVPLPERLAEITNDVRSLVPPSAVLAVLERGFSGGAGPAAWLLGTVAGALLAALEADGVRTLIVPPKVRAKLATGKGNADKLDVLDAARGRLGYVGKSFDEADALWLGVAGVHLLDWPSAPSLPQSHLDVLEQYREEANKWT